MCMYYGVAARQAAAPEHPRQVLELAEKFAVELGVAGSGDGIVVVGGRPVGQTGNTNTLVVHTVG